MYISFLKWLCSSFGTSGVESFEQRTNERKSERENVKEGLESMTWGDRVCLVGEGFQPVRLAVRLGGG
jgi:hypothetical protein